MFDTILVANRGEIARRVIRTLRRLGIRSIAVYSDADIEAPHTREADAAVRIGPAAAAESYLSVDAIIAAAVQTEATAIHPGYGFLSESVALARACREAGVVFIGPDEHALEVMGDKIRARDHVSRHGVPVLPGTGGEALDDGGLLAKASEIGFPLLVKPSAGGGGKGMQEVRDAARLPEALVAARRVAMAAFGDDTLLLERLVIRPRHIEVQLLADAHGTTLHLGERECTLQRRHQKVIEESPSVVVDGSLRARLGAAAVAAAQSVAYRGAGTVEFLVSDEHPEEFHFIEMNTRLQVEHPITELVTGLDLVAEQVRIAAGEPLSFSQPDVRLAGHAIEGRVYAESPERGFLPATGTILEWRAPYGDGVRVDPGVETASVVSADYDPLLAKIIAYGADRAEAMRRLDEALAATVVLGVDTNVSFLRHLLADERVRSGELDTGLIDSGGPFAGPAPPPVALAAAAGVVAERERADAGGTPWTSRSGWRASGPPIPPIRRFLTETGEVVRAAALSGEAVTAVEPDGAIWVHADGAAHRLRPVSRRDALVRRLAARTAATTGTDPQLRAPMPGTVVAMHAADGAHVVAGEPVLTIEAMKMEQPLVAPHDGVLTVSCAVGDRVTRDAVLARVNPVSDERRGDA